jgi:flavin-dependent dehydrogenase
VVFTYWLDTGIEGYHWYYRPGVSAGAIPTNHGLTCVFVSVTQDRFHREFRHGSDDGYRRLLLECAPDLAAVVERSQQGEKFHGFAGHPGYFRQSCGPGWALVGDAGYFKDPLTAHGITDALIDAEVLARAVAAERDDAIADYQRARDERATGLFDVTDAVASFEWDLPGVQQLHRSLSEEMKRETRLVSQFDETGDPGNPPGARPDPARHPQRQE